MEGSALLKGCFQWAISLLLATAVLSASAQTVVTKAAVTNPAAETETEPQSDTPDKQQPVLAAPAAETEIEPLKDTPDKQQPVLAAPVAKTEIEQLKEIVDKQQQVLAAHQKLLDQQSKALTRQNDLIEHLRKELDVNRGGENPVIAEAEAIIEEQIGQAAPAQPSLTTPPAETLAQATPEAQEIDSQLTAQQDDPSRNALKGFKGSFRIPGSAAAIRFGGFIKTTGIYNFDPLESGDQFIVGSIPTGDFSSNAEPESNLTANQSRMNFELREPTDSGEMRAFLEGDFAGVGNTFQLRHAFGQYRELLAGKTWTAFADLQANPEEVDFEGLNAKINVRQTQLRYSPRFGQDREFQISLEDPDTELQNGNGIKYVPDVIGTIRLPMSIVSHMKLALILRQIRGQMDEGDGSVKKETGYGINLSARHALPTLGEKDNIIAQITHGKGIGRYINDLNTIGNYDGAFNTLTGELELFEVTAGYISGQHWWNSTMRSNITAGVVVLDDLNFSSGSEYERTIRVSTNFLWSPITRMDLGGEILWGIREDIDGSDGDASQLQITAKYRF